MLLNTVMIGWDSLSVLRAVGEGGSHLESMLQMMKGVIAYMGGSYEVLILGRTNL